MSVGKVVGHVVGQAARGIADAESIRREKNVGWWWFTRVLMALVLVVGWIFILWQNKFHVDPPVVVICLGYLAVVLALGNLWRVGAATVAQDALIDDGWARPVGERGELEREKKTLLKSIKEAEFDREMGKLSKVDADDLIGMYRTRAIEVIKELDRMDASAAAQTETPRQAIERELAARIAIEQEQAKGRKKKKQKTANARAAAAKAALEPVATPAPVTTPTPVVAAAPAPDEGADDDDGDNDDDEHADDDAPPIATDVAAVTEPDTSKTSTEASS